MTGSGDQRNLIYVGNKTIDTQRSYFRAEKLTFLTPNGGAPEMGMSEKARELRRCRGIRKDGGRCQCFACWGDEFCHRHGGVKTAKAVCKCIAYNWPHRPGGGYCEWPDHPRMRLTTPAGTKAEKMPRWTRRISVRNGWNDVSGYK
jgi:hypothetical protein